MPLQVMTTFHNFPMNAQQAFQAAVNVWSAQLTSTVPIRIDAYYGTPLGGNLVGLCVPNAVQNAPNLQPNTWYASALADKLSGADQQPGQPDLEIYFENLPNWNFAFQNPLQGGQIDFMTVALHELCHGLGFVTLFAEDPLNGDGTYGDANLIDAMLQVAVPSGAPVNFPLPAFNNRTCICGAQLQNAANQVLTNTALFANPSAALGGQLTSGAIYFQGPNNRNYQFYAPPAFLFGSSMTHFDPTSLPNSLMLPAVGNTQIHVPDAETLNVLHDLGW